MLEKAGCRGRRLSEKIVTRITGGAEEVTSRRSCAKSRKSGDILSKLAGYERNSKDLMYNTEVKGKMLET